MVRNRLKRRVRECYRLKLRAMLPAGVAMVVIARKGAGELKWTAIDTELLGGVAKSRPQTRWQAQPIRDDARTGAPRDLSRVVKRRLRATRRWRQHWEPSRPTDG